MLGDIVTTLKNKYNQLAGEKYASHGGGKYCTCMIAAVIDGLNFYLLSELVKSQLVKTDEQFFANERQKNIQKSDFTQVIVCRKRILLN